jgi:hypothetical protein
LYQLQKYCFDWQLTVNINKTQILTFQKTFSPTPMLFYDHKPLTETKEYNFLGTVIDNKGTDHFPVSLTYGDHINIKGFFNYWVYIMSIYSYKIHHNLSFNKGSNRESPQL